MASPVELTVYPDDCDAYGHMNQASFLSFFERARWELLAQGPGMDLFQRHRVWPAVRKATVEFLQQVFPGDRLRFEIEVVHWGETSFTLRQRARKVGGGDVAEAELVFVTLGQNGRPVPIPAGVGDLFGARLARRTGASQQFVVRGLATTAELVGDGPPVLFVHGFPLDRTMWRPVASALTGWRRILPDLRGLGLSEGPDDGYAMAEYADDLAALLDVLRIPNAVVCGLSMGGYVAFELLRRHPNRVRALVLANTRAAPDDADGRTKRDATIARIRRDGLGFLADEMLPRLLGSDTMQTSPDVVRQVRGMMTAQPALGLIGALTAMRDRPDARPMLGAIRVPTLVLHGSDDQLIPLTEARAMADAIPGAHFAAIPAAGHLAPLEQAVNTGRVIREFLEALL
ncbi:MAG: alpha/beta fold hydrolase [Gemmatimonadota bacterium]|nr:alpha/beta fold hydrolase [Gemmatimonadota bacterium]